MTDAGRLCLAGLLKAKVAVVTGAGRGIGSATAKLMAAEGARVIVNDYGVAPDGTSSSSTPADETVAAIKRAGGQAVVNYGDVSRAETGEALVKMALETFGHLDILVNNAGILRDRMVFNMTPEEWDAVIKVHLYGVFNCTKPAVRSPTTTA